MNDDPRGIIRQNAEFGVGLAESARVKEPRL